MAYEDISYDDQIFRFDHSCCECAIGTLKQAKLLYKELEEKIREVEGSQEEKCKCPSPCCKNHHDF